MHAELSFGCASYLIKRPEGNILVDVPRYVPKLVNRIKVCCTSCQYTHERSGNVRAASRNVKQRARVISTSESMQAAITAVLSSRRGGPHHNNRHCSASHMPWSCVARERRRGYCRDPDLGV